MMKASSSLFVPFLMLGLMASCGEESNPPESAPLVKEPAEQEPVKKEADIDLENLPDRPLVLMKTTMGDMKIELYHDKAPITVKNFLAYVKSGFYDGVIFQRVMENFMMQGGGYTEAFYANPNTGRKTPRAPIKNEADNGLKNLKYTLSMARMPAKDTASSQFFINFKDNKSLDHRGETDRTFGYAVFGKVIEGTDVVEKIEAVEKKPLPPQNREIALPVRPIKIISVEYLSN